MADEKAVNPETEKLAKLVYHLSHIVELWREDRNVLIKGFTRHEELLEKFSQQLNELKRLEKSIADTLGDTITAAFVRTIGKVGEAVTESATQEAEKVLKDLEKSVQQTKSYLEYQRKNVLSEERKNHWKTLIITIIVSMGGSLLMVWYLLSRSALIMDKDMLNTYYNGVLLQEVWPKLSKAEKRHIEGYTAKTADAKDTATSGTTEDSGDS